MATRRARSTHDAPVIMLAVLVVLTPLCALLIGRMNRLRSDVCRSIEGIHDHLLTQIDELCTAAHTVGELAEKARSAGDVTRPPDLAADAEEAERIAEQEERGERTPTKGQRARRAAS